MVTHNTLKSSLIALSVAASLFIAPTEAMASNGLQSQMDKLFNEMSNTTPPGVYESQRRGVLAGGRFTVKTRIFNENLVSFAPPSWKAGCGGVDLFGGSISFIKADQLVEILRTVAANAKGYAFQLALDNVFPDGAKWIENFQKKVQELNQHLGNSCQLAQNLMDDSGAANVVAKSASSLRATIEGLFEDSFSANQQKDGDSPEEKLMNKDPSIITGNVIWEQLKKNNVASWFVYGDNKLLEAIMSMTGTIVIPGLVDDPNFVIPELVDDPNLKKEKTLDVRYLPGFKITLTDFVEGASQVKIYSCNTDTTKCLNPSMQTINMKGLKTKVLEILLGTSSSPGVIYKYATNSGTLTEPEKAFVSNLPGGVGTIVRNLSVLSQDGAYLFATESSGAIALTMMYSFTEELFRAARIAMANSSSPYKTEALKLIERSQQQIRSEYTILSSQYGDMASQIKKYNNLLDNIRKQKYMLATLSNPPSTN